MFALLTDGLILSLIFSAVLLFLGWRLQSLPIIFISSLGWLISAMQIFQQTNEFLPTALIMMLALSQFMVVNNGGAR